MIHNITAAINLFAVSLEDLSKLAVFWGSLYLSDWRFDYYVLKAVICFYCLEVLV